MADREALQPDRRRTVVHIIARLNVGGPAINVILLTARLDPARYHSLLTAGTVSKSEGDMAYLAELAGVEPIIVTGLGRELSLTRDSATLIRLARLLRVLRPDVVHTHTAKAGTLGRIAARMVLPRSTRVIHTFHGHVFHSYFGRNKTRIFLAIERWLAKRTDLLIAVSETTRRELIELRVAPPERICTVELGIDLAPLQACSSLKGQLKAELKLPADSVLVGLVCRLVPVKAVDIFIRAAAELRDQWPQVYFAVIGDGELRAPLEALASSLGLDGRLLFTGFRRDLPRVYADLDIVALTSRNEGLPTSLVEAMAAGCIVVATRVGGVPDLIEDGVTGYLVEPGDYARYAERMAQSLQEQAKWPAMRAGARKCASARFGLERLLRQMAGIYDGTDDGAAGAGAG
ncbi:MAG: glycosyltransferase [Armatimonadetes bacterium]|nr:glycosyltransferase [Armatimonadota bacterium]MDE2206780.1 glycosyltransferase [Armatimonadota bacterium]